MGTRLPPGAVAFAAYILVNLIADNFETGGRDAVGGTAVARLVGMDTATRAELSPPISSLTERGLTFAVDALTKTDSDLARVVAAFGCPPLWARPSGFPTLIHIILEQQVSLASAQAAFDRLSAAGPVRPESFLRFSDNELRMIGFSRQKAAYVRSLAAALLSGEMDLEGLEHQDDGLARSSLTNLKGIGPWSADIYLMMALRRPDVWPRGDLALNQALQEVKGLAKRPTQEEASAIAERWRPWRAAAARVLWHWYLSTPRRRASATQQTSRLVNR